MRWLKWYMMLSKSWIEPQKSGILLIDKPAGFSSHDIIAISRRILKTKKIGHSGTLDPMATGLLILLIGRTATRRQKDFLKLSKIYSARLKLGAETDSWDADGKMLRQLPVPPLTQNQVDQAVESLTGTVHQPIPFFSAKRINGKHMYDLARQGAPLERRYSDVTVEWKEAVLAAPDEILFTVHCSCGTYVRALGYLLAEKLGCVGHLTALRRLEIGSYRVQNAFDGNLLKNTDTNDLYARVELL